MKSPIITSKKKGLCLSVVFAMAMGTASAGQSPAARAGKASGRGADAVERVIERYVEACGGPALADVQAEKRRGTLLRGRSGPVPFETMAKAPGKWVYNQVFAYGDQVSYGCDGTTAWIQDTKNIEPMGDPMRLELEMLLDVRAPLRLRDFFPEMRFKGTEERDGRRLNLVQARSPDGREAELAFDVESGLLVRAGDLAFDDYRPIGKVKRPHAVRMRDDERGLSLGLKMEFTEIIQDMSLEDSVFNRPLCVLPARASPLFKARRYIKVSDEALQACVGVYRPAGKTDVTFNVTRQQNHLMIERTGWGRALEIRPESESDYSIRFLDFECHFVRDSSGRVTALEIGAARSVRAERIVPQDKARTFEK